LRNAECEKDESLIRNLQSAFRNIRAVFLKEVRTLTSSYGLTHPVRRAEVKWAHGAQNRSVAMGNLNPVGNAVYAHIDGESDVLLVGSYFLTSLDMALQGLRAGGSKFVDLNCSAGT